MGKGKGAPDRWCSVLPRGFIFIKLNNVSLIRSIKFKKKLEKRIKMPLQILHRFVRLIRVRYLGSNSVTYVRAFNDSKK
jgi:hypothetical protein